MSVLDTVGSWLADEGMWASAQAGISVGVEAYNQLDPRMVQPPADVMVAYEQATYFVALAARRAMRERRNSASLFAGLNLLSREADEASDNIGFICSTTGYLCPTRGSAEVLEEAIRLIEESDAPADDKARITAYLQSNRSAAVWKTWRLPIAVAVVSGVGVGWWWYRSRRAQ